MTQKDYPMPLFEHDKHQISLIDEQTNALLEKEASSDAVLNALMDFIPEALCLLESTNSEELKPYLSRYPGFAFFMSLIEAINHS
jgi:hypothetical protein